MLAVAVFSASILECGGSEADPSAGFPEHALATFATDDGSLVIDVRTSPEQPPTRGASRVQLRVHEAATGTPRDGLTVSAVPWMPAMGHGASVRPTVVATSDGVYELSDVTMFMPGRWELRAELAEPNKGASHAAVITFDVP